MAPLCSAGLLLLLALLAKAETDPAAAASEPTHAAPTNSLPTNPTPQQLAAYPAHCECRCCSRAHFRTTCAEEAHIVPLPPQQACDSRLSTLNDASVCSVSMCKLHFASSCTSPSFFRHTCVTHKSFLNEWWPYIFAVCTLLVLAFLARRYIQAYEARAVVLEDRHPKMYQQISPALHVMHASSTASNAARVPHQHQLTPRYQSPDLYSASALYSSVPSFSRLPPAAVPPTHLDAFKSPPNYSSFQNTP